MQQCMPEPVGSPAVLFDRVSNLPLRVVRSLLISINEGGIVMGEVWCRLIVCFEDPFWVGVFERIQDGKLAAAKVTFGSEPKDYEVSEFILRRYYSLQFSPAVETAVKDREKNPKRMQRDVKRQMENTGIGTKSQQALKLQQEQNKKMRKEKSREKKQAEYERSFETKQKKKTKQNRNKYKRAVA